MAVGTNPVFGTLVVKALADLPARMVPGTAIDIAITGFDYRINLDIEKLPVAGSIDATRAWTVVWDETFGLYSRTPFSQLPAGVVDWNVLANKPSTFPPDPHTHPVSEVTGLQPALDIRPVEAPADGHVYGRQNEVWVDLAAGVPIAVDWNAITGKPAEFPPTAHTHTSTQITDATTTGRALMVAANPTAGRTTLGAITADDNARVGVQRAGTPIGTRRAINIIDGANVSTTVADDAANERINITLTATGGGGSGGIPEAPQDGNTYGRRDAGWVTIAAPTFDWSQITGKPSTFPPSAHTHPISDVTNLQSSLDAKLTDAPNDANTYGRKGAAWVNLNTTLTVTWGNVTGKPSTFPPSAHQHPISDVTSLQAALDAKVGPDAPSDGLYYARRNAAWAAAVEEAPNDGLQYARQGKAWSKVTGGAIIAETAPATPLDSSFWWQSTTGILFLRYNDGNSSQFVQVASPGLVAPPADDWEYVNVNGVWRQKERTFDVNGLAQVDIPVPAWAKGVKFEASLVTAAGSSVRLSLDGTTFLAGASDYQQQGASHNTGGGATAFTTNTQIAVNAIFFSPGGDADAVPHSVSAELNLTRPSTGVFHLKTYSKSQMLAAGSLGRTFWGQGWMPSASAGAALAVKAIRIFAGSGTWGASSYINARFV